MKKYKIILCIAAIIFCFTSVLYSQINIEIELPQLTGEYGVGTTLLPLMDSSRLETFTEDIPDDFREVMVQIWYPINRGMEGDTIEYFDETTEAAAVAEGFADDFFKNVKAHAIKNIPVADSAIQFPVLIFSPGLAVMYSAYQAFIENVVSHGYIVAGINHPYFAFVTSFPDGHYIAQKTLTGEELETKFPIIVADAQFVIKELNTLNSANSGHLLSERMDLETMGMYGHSYGGACALETGIQVPEVKAIINMDGTHFGEGYLGDIHIPIYIMLNEEHIDETIDIAWNNLKGHGYKAILNGSKHMDFSDLTFYPNEVIPSEWLWGIGTIDSIISVQFSIKTTIHFFDAYLKNKPIDSIIVVADTYEEVELEISPNTENSNPDHKGNNSTPVMIIQNYPNPVKQVTNITFILPGNQKAELIIANSHGRQIERININGKNSYKWKTGNVANGIYFCRIKTKYCSASKMMLLQR